MKKLLSVVAAALVALTFVGCVMDEDGINWNTYTKDKQNKIAFYAQIQPGATLKGEWSFPDTSFFVAEDPSKDPSGTKVVDGFDNKYTVNYTNSTADTGRYFKETALKHAGALIKVTFNPETTAGKPSKMGVIFDLKANATNATAKDFYVVGVGYGDKSYYVSKFTNVTDFQAYNFGTDLTDNPAGEIVIEKLTSGNFNNLPAAGTDGNTSVYVYYKLVKDGSFDWAILADLTDDEIKMFKGNKKFNATKLEDLGDKVLKSGNTKDKAGAEYEEAPISKVKATDLL
ncbi:MAG: hypothetical protein K6G09_01170 [Treponema sp.]|nr:hypothetical protein [Treponema sp.]